MPAALGGVFPPIATIFNPTTGDVDARAIAANVAKLMTTGLAGVLALGSNGEAGLLDDGECDEVIGAAREGVPRERLLLVGVGRESTRATIAAARRAAELGADAVLVRPPSYYKSHVSNDALIAPSADVTPHRCRSCSTTCRDRPVWWPPAMVAVSPENARDEGNESHLERLGICGARNGSFQSFRLGARAYPRVGRRGGVIRAVGMCSGQCGALRARAGRRRRRRSRCSGRHEDRDARVERARHRRAQRAHSK